MTQFNGDGSPIAASCLCLVRVRNIRVLLVCALRAEPQHTSLDWWLTTLLLCLPTLCNIFQKTCSCRYPLNGVMDDGSSGTSCRTFVVAEVRTCAAFRQHTLVHSDWCDTRSR